MTTNAEQAKARLLGTMTPNEIKWAKVALHKAIQETNANPDVGWGPSIETILDRITPKGIILNQTEINQIITPGHEQALR